MNLDTCLDTVIILEGTDTYLYIMLDTR